MPADLANLGLAAQAGKLTPYAALVLFAFGLFTSNLLLSFTPLAKPFVGAPVLLTDYLADYFEKGNSPCAWWASREGHFGVPECHLVFLREIQQDMQFHMVSHRGRL